MVSLYLFLRSLPLPAAFSVLLAVLFSSFERLLPLSSASYLITSHQTVCNCDSSVFGWIILAHSVAYFTSKLHALPDPPHPTPFIPLSHGSFGVRIEKGLAWLNVDTAHIFIQPPVAARFVSTERFVSNKMVTNLAAILSF